MAEEDLSDLDHGNFERIACLVFCAITPTFLLTRFWSRILAKQLGPDDWSALAACIFTLSCNMQTLVAISHGWGRHGANLSAEQLEICLILHYTFQLTYKISVALNKASILLLYLRIMPQQAYRRAIFCLLGLVGTFAFATCVAGIFQCTPVDRAWHKTKPGSCYNLVDAWYANAVFSIITDILILLLPMYMVYKLQKAMREKLLLVAMFGVGIFVTFTSIMRFFALKSAKNPDTTYDINSGFWSIIEINVGVICICLPPLRALLSHHVPFFGRSRTHVTGSNSNGPYPKQGGYLKSDPSKNELGGSTNGSHGHKWRNEPKDSEEELVFGSNINSMAREGVIMKKTEIAITASRRDGGDDIEMKDWERQLR